MTPRLARLLESLIANEQPDDVYTFVRDGHIDDLTHILNELEAKIPLTPTTCALLRLTHLLLETRDPRGSDNVRSRDHATARLKSYEPVNVGPSTRHRSKKGRGKG